VRYLAQRIAFVDFDCCTVLRGCASRNLAEVLDNGGRVFLTREQHGRP
jgi:hypothetical protein